MEAKPEQRFSYLKEIESIKETDIVYIDESGIDRNSYKNRGWGKIGKVL